MLDPAFLSRQRGVRSMKPIGVMQTPPSRRYAGTGPLASADSHGLPEAPDAAWGRGPAIGLGYATGNGAIGIIGVVEATWPIPLNVEVLEDASDALPET